MPLYIKSAADENKPDQSFTCGLNSEQIGRDQIILIELRVTLLFTLSSLVKDGTEHQDNVIEKVMKVKVMQILCDWEASNRLGCC